MLIGAWNPILCPIWDCMYNDFDIILTRFSSLASANANTATTVPCCVVYMHACAA